MKLIITEGEGAMDYNYHTHTYFCSHAEEKIEEYIKTAIKGGIKYMGFSDHMPHIAENGFESSYRVQFSKAKDYYLEIDALREKYKNDIDIKIGFEMEYFPQQFNDMVKNAVMFGAEYLILGQHYLKEEQPESNHITAKTSDISDLKKYVAVIIEGIRSGVFTYVAHPDALNFIGDENIYKNEMRKICIASRDYNVPLELNFLGIRDNRNYPNNIFWEMAGEEKAPVTFGFDSHEVEAAFDKSSLFVAEEMVKKYNLNYNGKPELVLLKNLI